MFALLRTTPLEFISSSSEDGDVQSFAFRPLRRLHALAGQHGLLTLPGVGTKAFSLASAPADPEVLIGTRLLSGSPYKVALAALQPGHRVTLRGPIMNFIVEPTLHEAVFLAQGVGITPYRSLLRDISGRGLATRTTLVHVGHGHAYRHDTEPLATTAYYPTNNDGFTRDLDTVLASQLQAVYYLSGSTPFIKNTAALLAEHGVPAKKIKKDQFRGYQDHGHHERRRPAPARTQRPARAVPSTKF